MALEDIIINEVIVEEEIQLDYRVGVDGVTFTPQVTEVSNEETILSFTNNGDKPNPEPTNIKGKAFTYDDFTPAQIESLQQPALDAAAIANAATNDVLEAEEVIQANEALRISAEIDRNDAEILRDGAEETRVTSEILREQSESIRKNAEILRNSSEVSRNNAELLRDSAEQTRINNEEDRVDAEVIRESNEDSRKANELIRIASESTRVNNELNRQQAEHNRTVAESDRVDAEILRESNEDTRESNEVIRQENEALRVSAENIRISNEGDATSGRVKAENDRVAAEIIREEVKEDMLELNFNPPKLFDISGRLIWHYWDLDAHAYVSSGLAGALNWRGTYSGTETYLPLDVVSYNESTWLCITESLGNLPTTAYFTPIAKGSYQYWLEAGNTGTYEDYLTWLVSKEDVINKKQTVTNSETDYPSGKAVYDALTLKIDKTQNVLLKEPTGFRNPESVIVTYDPIERKVTLTGTIEAYYHGVRVESLVSGWVSDAHPTTLDHTYFLYYNGTSFIWADNLFPGFEYLAITGVYYRTSIKFAYRECHGFQQWQSHRNDHYNIGTYRISGGDISNIILASTTVDNRRPIISECTIQDEDLTTVNAILSSKKYTQRFLSGSSTINYTLQADDIVPLSGNNPYYNSFSSPNFGQTLMPANSVMTVWLYETPVTADSGSQELRHIFVQGQSITQAQNGSAGALLTAKNTERLKSAQELNVGTDGVVASEYVCIHKFIIQYDGTNWTIVDSIKVTGSRASQTSILTGNFLSAVAVDSTITGDGTPINPLSIATSLEVYNITLAVPLTAGQYYTSTTARVAVPTSVRKRGLELLYETASGVWYCERFIGASVTTWTTEIDWEVVPNKLIVENTEEVTAESLVQLKNRIDALQKIIQDMILGTVQIDTLSIVKTLNLFGSSNLILTGTAAPAVVPDFIGQFFIKTSATTACYQATGISAVGDWKQIG